MLSHQFDVSRRQPGSSADARSGHSLLGRTRAGLRLRDLLCAGRLTLGQPETGCCCHEHK